MTDRFEPFPCGDCGGTVRMLSAAGEVREFRRGLRVAVPAEVLVPRCERCGETYLGEADSRRVDAAVRAVFLEQQKETYAACVAALQREHGMTLREIENICGVTPTYFSHVMKGRRVASVTLTRLLEAFVACPAEVARHRGAQSRPAPQPPLAEEGREAPQAVAPRERRVHGGVATVRVPRPPSAAGIFGRRRRSRRPPHADIPMGFA